MPTRSSTWGRYPEQARIPFELLRRTRSYPGEIGMCRVDHVVWFARNERGWYPEQSTMAAGSPSSTGRLSFWATERSPVRRRIVQQILNRDVIVCFRHDQHRSAEVAPLNQPFEHGERQRAYGIDNWDAWRVPASAIERSACPVPNRMQACAEPVEPHETFKPVGRVRYWRGCVRPAWRPGRWLRPRSERDLPTAGAVHSARS